MKRFLPLMAALAILLWLPVGASAYTITWGSTQQSTDPEATLNGTSGDFFSNPAVVNPDGITHYAYTAWNTITDENSSDSVTATWSLLVTQPQVKYGPGGIGKTTYFTEYINPSFLLSLTNGNSNGYAGYSARLMPSFQATQEDMLHTPQLQLKVSWGGNHTAGLFADVNFYWWGGLGSLPVEIFGEGGFSANASGTTTHSAVDLATFLNNPSLFWNVSLTMTDTTSYSGENANESPWVALEVDLIEPNMSNPEVPLPPSLILLGSGLLTLALARRRFRG
jgi:hypothetical protein